MPRIFRSFWILVCLLVASSASAQEVDTRQIMDLGLRAERAMLARSPGAIVRAFDETLAALDALRALPVAAAYRTKVKALRDEAAKKVPEGLRDTLDEMFAGLIEDLGKVRPDYAWFFEMGIACGAIADSAMNDARLGDVMVTARLGGSTDARKLADTHLTASLEALKEYVAQAPATASTDLRKALRDLSGLAKREGQAYNLRERENIAQRAERIALLERAVPAAPAPRPNRLADLERLARMDVWGAEAAALRKQLYANPPPPPATLEATRTSAFAGKRTVDALEAGKAEEARAQALAAIRAEPDDANLYSAVATTYLMQDDYRRAIVFYDESLWRDPDKGAVLFARANATLLLDPPARGMTASASPAVLLSPLAAEVLPFLDKAMARLSTFQEPGKLRVEVLRLRAFVNAALGNYTQAASDAQQSRQFSAPDEESRPRLLLLQYLADRLAGRSTDLSAAFNEEGRAPEFWQLVFTEVRNGGSTAETTMRRLANTTQQSFAAAYIGAALFAAGKPRDAKPYLEKVAKKQTLEHLVAQALLYRIETGASTPPAPAPVRPAAPAPAPAPTPPPARPPSTPPAVPVPSPGTPSARERGVAAFKRGDYAEAAKLLREAVLEDPIDGRVRNDLGIALLESCPAQTGSPAVPPCVREAIEAFQVASKLMSTDAIIRNNLATAYRHAQMFNEALATYSESLNLMPDADAFLGRSAVYLSLNRPKEAVGDAYSAVALDGSAVAYGQLGRAQMAAGNRDAARATLATLESKFPGSREARNLADAVIGFGGVGMALSNAQPGVIDAVNPDGPAARAGLTKGDVITKVDGTAVAGMSTDQIAPRLRGAPGSTVTVTVRLGASAREMDIVLTRAQIPPAGTPASPAPAPATGPAGTWDGEYVCGQGRTLLELQIPPGGMPLSGRFSFRPPPGGAGEAGSYTVFVMVENNTAVTVVPSAWVKQPEGYTMVGASLKLDGNTMTGKIISPNCGAITLRRRQ